MADNETDPLSIKIEVQIRYLSKKITYVICGFYLILSSFILLCICNYFKIEWVLRLFVGLVNGIPLRIIYRFLYNYSFLTLENFEVVNQPRRPV